MAEDLSPTDIRARKFRASRRGYDRAEVGEYLERVAGRVHDLEGELATINTRLSQLGIAELPDLREELEDVGVEIQAVLDAAMTAAEGLRTRASADAAERLADADATSAALRGDAWNTGTELLHQADAEANLMVAEARQDALYIRAEAEQDAKRLVTDARRQADEMLRSSREEGERIVVIAKAESEAILEGARQAAEKAQERARALENRRAELLGELEAAESAMRDLESTRQTGVRVIAPGDDSTRWPEDEGAVRILPAATPEPAATVPEPVDAEAMAAEVEQMRTAVTMPQPSPQETDAPEQTEPVEPEPVESEPVESEPVESEPVESEPAPAEEPAAAEPVAEPPAESVPETPHDDAAEPDEPEDSGIEDKTTIVSDDPDIDALFAKLRQSPEPPVAQEPAPGVEPEPEEPVAPALHVVPPLERGEGFERRDRMLLPIENRGLRGLKRRIVELQNRVLEELRTSSGEWRLGREFVIEVMGDELDAVLLDSYRAGHAAAAESIGREEALLTGGPEQGAAETFTADLHHDVQAVIERDAEGGSKRLSSDVGRVFRAWRTEEAERHVRQAARRAFNDGLLAGYGRLGVEAVEIIAPGRPCGECAADSGITWAPSNGVPEGVKIPPTGRGCAALVVPAGSNGFDSRPDQ